MRRNLERPISFLSFNNFKRLLDSGNFRYVGLHGWGEPLLNQQLFEMVKYAESKGVFTNLTTNGTLIREKIDSIFDSGLREIAFGVYDKGL
jgi:MoaA/NifB/PqqE/SkfB family radical SAM enzyme